MANRMQGLFKKEEAGLGGYAEGKPDPEIARLQLKLEGYSFNLDHNEVMLCHLLSNNEKESLKNQLGMKAIKKDLLLKLASLQRKTLRKEEATMSKQQLHLENDVDSSSSEASSEQNGGNGKKKKNFHSISIYGLEESSVPPKQGEGVKSFFGDLNYGDVVISYPNPFLEFMFTDIEGQEMRVKRILDKSSRAKKVKKTPSDAELEKIKKAEIKIKNNRQKRLNNFLKLQEKPQLVSFENALEIYKKYVGLTTEIKELTKSYMNHEKIAFINMVILHSNKFYGTDLSAVPDSSLNKPFRDKPLQDLQHFRHTEFFEEYFDNRGLKYYDDLLVNANNKFIKKYLKDFKIDRRFLNYILRKITILKFNYAGIWTRQFYNESFTKIFLVVKCQEEQLKDRAKVEEMSKQLELGWVDLMSLEPVDHDFRPYKHKKKTYTEVLAMMEEMKLQKGAGDDEPEMKGNSEDNIEEIQVASSDIQYIVRVIGAIRKLNDQAFLNMIEKQKKKIMMQQSHINKRINTQQPSFGTLMADDVLPRKEWEMVYVYYQVFSLWYKIIKKFEDQAAFAQNHGFLLRMISQKAMGDTNEAFTWYRKNICLRCCGIGSFKKQYLKSIWEYMGTEPIGPYLNFTKNVGMTQKWRTYQVNELGMRSIFSSMERAKLASSMISEMINIFKLIELKTAIDWFPLHDNFVRKGELREELFEKVPGDLTEGHLFLDDFNAVCDQLKDEADEKDFIGESLDHQLRYKFYSPTDINIDVVQSYFGEKIALYFRYLQFYCRSLFWIGLVGTAIFVSDEILLRTNQFLAYKIIRISFSIISVAWTTFFLEYWKRTQKMFAIKYGQLDYEAKEQERPGFLGYFIRDLGSNEYNFLYYSKFKRAMKMMSGVFVSVLIIIASIVSTLYLLIFKEFLRKESYPDLVVSILPAVLNSIQVKIFQTIYYKVGKAFNFFENHKSYTGFEDSLIFKIYSFSFFNTLNSLFIIGFIKLAFSGTFGQCIQPAGDPFQKELACYSELQTQVRTFFIVNFATNFLEIIIPWVKSKLMKKKIFAVKQYSWGAIDQLIQDEDGLESYMMTPEIDGVLMDYLEIIIQFTFLSLFGVAFPLAYFMAYLTDVSEIHIDKLKLLNFTKRPVPKGASDIGTWASILDFISFTAIFVNAGIVVFTASCYDEIFELQGNKASTFERAQLRTQAYVYTVLVLLFAKWMVQLFVVDIPENLNNILQRHQDILQNLSYGVSTSMNLARSGAFMATPPSLQPYVDDINKSKPLEQADNEQILNQMQGLVQSKSLTGAKELNLQGLLSKDAPAPASKNGSKPASKQNSQAYDPTSQVVKLEKVVKPQQPDDDLIEPPT